MNIKYVLKDELGNSGTNLPLSQGETKTITCLFLDQAGQPFTYLGTLTELVVKIFLGISTPSLQKKLSLTAVSLITGNGGTIGFSFSLSASDTNSIPASSTVNMSAIISTASTTEELDLPASLNVSAPLITN